jgi:hypothetical protein
MPDHLYDIVHACWAHNPSDRPSASWVVEQLEAALAQLQGGAAGAGAAHPVPSRPASMEFGGRRSADLAAAGAQQAAPAAVAPAAAAPAPAEPATGCQCVIS